MANSWINPNVRQAIYQRDNMTCVYCGCTCESGNTGKGASLDHIVSQKELASVAADDKHFGMLRRDPKNLVVACRLCNQRKGTFTVFEFCNRIGISYADTIADIAMRVSRAI
jgi:5-methylcytosine-specific restriction endonuclease McrA